MGEEQVIHLIAQIEEIDDRIIQLNTKRGMINPDEAQLLKYKRCFLLDRLTRAMNGIEEDDDEEWGELK